MVAKTYTPRQKVDWLLENATPNGECLDCHLSFDKDGYCQVTVMYKNYRAHRLVYEQLVGPIDGLLVMHSCDNPRCINPKHLSIGTQQDNINDMIAKGRKADTTGNTRALTDEQVHEAMKMYATGTPQHLIAARFRVNQSTISLALKMME